MELTNSPLYVTITIPFNIRIWSLYMTHSPDRSIINSIETDLINRQDLEFFYCRHMIKRQRCPKIHGQTCAECVRILQAITHHELSSAKDPEAVVRWRLKEYAKGNISLWISDKKKPVRRYHASINPFEDPAELMRRVVPKPQKETSEK